ncbi:hypothetical protein P8C59_007987 [Phyllachora maydis]|uniref:Uncharacterized protein n=1 Tax=Phyllachora maydis TaxID=1825666 RepID=A0AAD9IAL2_9PEZI|nr:hypothetical protein P8C59_007987 [Phyllachora maydis]
MWARRAHGPFGPSRRCWDGATQSQEYEEFQPGHDYPHITYNNWIIVGFIFAGLSISAVVTDLNVRKYQTGTMCLYFKDHFTTLDPTVWSHEVAVDGFGTGSFGWTTTDPLNSIFFFQVIFTDLFHIIGPVGGQKTNSRFYPCTQPSLRRAYMDGFEPSHVTTQMPVYKGGMESVIIPTIRSLPAAISYYESHGGTSCESGGPDQDGREYILIVDSDTRVISEALESVATPTLMTMDSLSTYQTTSTLPLDFKRDWAITDFAAIIPLAINIVDHALCPLVLNPSLMIFNY